MSPSHGRRLFTSIGGALVLLVCFAVILPSIRSAAEAPARTSAASQTLPPQQDPLARHSPRIAVDPPQSSTQTSWVTLEKGQTLITTLVDSGVPMSQAYDAAKNLATEIDPTKLRAGLPIQLDLSDAIAPSQPRLIKMALVPARDRRIVVSLSPDERYAVRAEQIAHDATIEISSGTIGRSLYEAARAKDVPDAVLLQAFPILGQRVDFQREIREGNRFSLGFERLDDGDRLGTHTGDLIYASIELDDKTLTMYRFTTSDGYTGFFDADGNSLRTSLSKTPVDGARLSSRFGKRDHPILGYSRAHKGLDFAAPRGSPIYAAGDGIVVRRGRYGSFGNYVRISHGEGYETAYAHLSKYADFGVGDRLRQGDLIGYVGATGLATGPNLHYEVLRNGVPVNPMRVESPPRRRLTASDLVRYRQQVEDLLDRRDDT